MVGMRNPLVERFGIGEVLLEHFGQHAPVEIVGCVKHLMLDHAARSEADFGHALNAGIDMWVLAVGQPLAGLDEEVDDLSCLDVEQRRQIGARMNHGIEIKLWRGEIDPEIAAALDQVCAFDHPALDKERRRIGFSIPGAGRAAEIGQCIHRLPPSGVVPHCVGLMATQAFH